MASTVKAISGNPIRNSGGVSMLGGTTGTHITKILSFANLSYNGPKFNKVPTNVTQKSVSAGDFAKMTPGRYIFMRYTNFIAGVASSKLNFASNDGRHNSIHLKENVRTLQRVLAGWNYSTGRFLSLPVSSNDTFKSIDGSAAVDQGARLGRANQGSFSYGIGTRTPTTKAYLAPTD